jgi:hypothetical protein
MLSDINECTAGDANKHECDSHAICKNTVGGYTCTCKPGYEGNGKACDGKFGVFKFASFHILFHLIIITPIIIGN